MVELKVGIKALELEYDRLQAEILKSKFAPQVFNEVPELGTLSQKQSVTYTVDVAKVVEVIGKDRALGIAKISKTELEKGVTKVELGKLEEKQTVTTCKGAVSYVFKAAKAEKDKA